MRTLTSCLLLVTLVTFITGCGSEQTQELNQDYMKSATELRKDVDAMFARTKGDYSQLTPEEKKRYLDSFKGNESSALAYWEKLKSGQSVDSRTAIPGQ